MEQNPVFCSRFRSIIISFILVVFIAGCGDDNGVSDPGLRPHQEPVGADIQLSECRTFRDIELSAGELGKMVLGQTGGLRASLLLKFDPVDSLFRDIVDEDSVSFRLYAEEGGPGSIVGPVSYTVKLITSAWSETTLTLNEFPACGAETGDGRLYNDVLPYYDLVRLPGQLVRDWLDDPADNHGILLLPTDTLSVVYIDTAESGTDGPRLFLATSDTDSLGRTRYRKTSMLPVDDSFVAEVVSEEIFADYLPGDFGYPDRMIVGNGVLQRGILRFDTAAVEAVPRGSTINRATLYLYTDASRSMIANPGFGLELYSLDEPEWTGDFSAIDGEDGEGPGTIEDLFDSGDALLDSIAVNVRVPFQEWVSGTGQVFGFVLKTTRERTDISYISIWTDSPDSLADLAPRLEVVYTEPPGWRF